MEQDGRDGDLEWRCQYGEKHASLAQITELISIRWRVAIFGLFGVGRLGRPPIYEWLSLVHRRTTLARSIPGIILYRYIHSLTLLFRCLTWRCMILSFSSFALLRRGRCRRSGCGFSGLEDEESASGVNSRRDALSIMVNYLIRSDHRLEGVSAGGTVEPEIVVLMSSSRMAKLLSCQHRF